MRNIACFDIGGTYIKYGVVSCIGDIIFKSKFKTPDKDCKNNVPAEIINKIKELRGQYDIGSVGISTAGQVNTEKGEVVFASENLPGYSGAKLSETINRKTGLECYVENDVNAAALGEMWKGAGQNLDTFVCIALGTGIGGAIVINRKLYKGLGEGAGEFGHMIINEAGEGCGCGAAGCYERYGSTSALVRNYAKSVKVDPKTVSGEDIMEAVKRGETAAAAVYNDFLNSIVTGLVNVTHILDPGTIVIGGGISAQGKPFFDEINRRFSERVMQSYGRYTKIIPAQLENDAGLLGACYTAIV